MDGGLVDVLWMCVPWPQYIKSGFLSGGVGGERGHLPPLGYAEISILHVNLFKRLYKSLNDTINGELCL